MGVAILNGFKKGINTIVITLFLSLIINVFFALSYLGPLIYYEYILLPILFIIINNRPFRVILLAGLIILNLIYNIAHLYYFNFATFALKAQFLLMTKFTFNYYLFILISIFLVVSICIWIVKLFENRITTSYKKYTLISFLFSNIIFSISIFTIDFFFGETTFTYTASTGQIDHP